MKWADPKRIFTCSWSDFFIVEADEWRSDAWNVIRDTPQHTWQILTKRPERIHKHLPSNWGPFGYANVMLGVSIGIQGAMKRMLDLTALKNDNSVFQCFLSLEPLLGPINLTENSELESAFQKIDWVIIGGESGYFTGKHRFRPSELEWYVDIIKQCRHFGKPVFVKQLGTHLAKELGLRDRHGGDISEWPDMLQIREFAA